MSGKSIISNSYLEDIGDAIRYKKGTSETFYPSQMGDAIRSIDGIVPTGTMEIDANGVYDVTEKAEAVVSVQPDLRPLSVSENGTYEPDDFDGYSDVTVDVEPALESLSVTENGLYLPESGVDGYDRVTVNVPQPSGSTAITQNGTYNVEQYASAVVGIPTTGYDAGTLIYEGDFSSVASEWNIKTLPDGSNFSFDKIEVELSNMGQGYNSGWRQYWRSDLPMTGNQAYMLSGGVRYYGGATALRTKSIISIDDDTYITLTSIGFDADNPVNISADAKRARHGGYDKITAYGWWSWNCPAGAHIKITGYNRTS